MNFYDTLSFHGDSGVEMWTGPMWGLSWCSCCYKYEDCGPPLCCLPRSAFKRNGIQDHQYFQQGSVRYLCRSGGGCCRPCPPRCPPCVRRPPPGKTYVTRFSDFDLLSQW